MKIEFARGDTYQKGFVLKANGATVTDTFDEIYFTVKTNYKETEYVFQKTMENSGIVDDGDGHYTLYIYPTDTNGLSFGDYDCDFEFVATGYKKTFYGKLTLTPEVTHASNES